MPPNHLAVYLTNRCNLSCSYCYVSVNEGPAVRLSFEDLRKNLDYFFDTVPGPDRKVTFLGGEPFLDFALLERAAAYARERGGDAVVLQTFTNGTLLTRPRLEALERLGVHVTVSLDGRQGTNDRRRKFFGAPERSVLQEALERLEGVPRENLGVSLVFDSETVDELLANVDFFYRMGFGRITFNPELYEQWPEERLAKLDAVMRGLRRYYKTILSGGRPFAIPILFAVLENLPKNRAGVRWWHDCHNIVLGPDRKFYACDKALSFPVGQAADQRVGDADAGMDWERRERFFAEAARFIESKGWGADESFCPMGVYFYGKEAGKDPLPLLENYHRVAERFTSGLLGMINDAEGLPAFQEIYADTRVV